MLADDAKLSLNKISMELKNNGFENIKTFDEGNSLFDEFNQIFSNHDSSQYLVITDIEMPGINGYELCKKVKSLSPETHVIILSSLIDENVKSECKNCMADSFILKREFNSLVNTIDGFIDI